MKEYFAELKRLPADSRILLLTHTDMDGAGAAVLLKSAFTCVDVLHCSNEDMSFEIMKAATSQETAEKYDFMIVSDISCSEGDAEIIDRHRTIDLALLDHHYTAVGLNRFSWACVHPEVLDGSYRSDILYGTGAASEHSSGTSLVYDYLDFCGHTDAIANKELAKKFAFFVAGYDTWDWVKRFGGDKRFRDMQTLFGQYGITEFERQFTERLSDPAGKELLNETDRLLLRIAESKKASLLERAAKKVRTGSILLDGRLRSFTYCAVNENLADMFEFLRANYNADIHMIDYGTGVSMRSDRNDINLGEIAKQFGGGGHPGAGGFKVPFEKRTDMLKEIMHTDVMTFDT